MVGGFVAEIHTPRTALLAIMLGVAIACSAWLGATPREIAAPQLLSLTPAGAQQHPSAWIPMPPAPSRARLENGSRTLPRVEQDQIPDGYRFYVKRYFELIRPREDLAD